MHGVGYIGVIQFTAGLKSVHTHSIINADSWGRKSAPTLTVLLTAGLYIVCRISF